MLFAVQCYDRPGGLADRLDNRQAHLSYLEKNTDTIKLAGPFLNDQGEPIGSLLIIEAQSSEEVRELLAQDPYARAKLFETVSIAPWRLTLHRFD